MAVAQMISQSLEEISEVKRWIDNDVEAGDTMIQEHADRLGRAINQLEDARVTMERLATESDPPPSME